MSKEIDVSVWNSNITWAVVAPQIDRAILRAFNGYSMAEDLKFDFNFRRALACGMTPNQIGTYHFFWPAKPVEQINAWCSTIFSFHPQNHAIDFEPLTGARVARISVPSPEPTRHALDAAVLTFHAAFGCFPEIYTSPGEWNYYYFKPEHLPYWLPECRLWLAQWSSLRKTWTPAGMWDLNNYAFQKPTKIPFGWTQSQLVRWQFTDKGRMSGFRNDSGRQLTFLDLNTDLK